MLTRRHVADLSLYIPRNEGTSRLAERFETNVPAPGHLHSDIPCRQDVHSGTGVRSNGAPTVLEFAQQHQ